MPLIQWIMQNLATANCDCSSAVICNCGGVVIPPIQLDNSLGLTYAIFKPGGAGGTAKKKKKNITVKFTFGGNIYKYEREEGDTSVTLLKIKHMNLKIERPPPSIKLEALRNINGKNYYLQEQRRNI